MMHYRNGYDMKRNYTNNYTYYNILPYFFRCDYFFIIFFHSYNFRNKNIISVRMHNRSRFLTPSPHSRGSPFLRGTSSDFLVSILLQSFLQTSYFLHFFCVFFANAFFFPAVHPPMISRQSSKVKSVASFHHLGIL